MHVVITKCPFLYYITTIKLEETDVLEQQQLYLCKARIEHLEQCPIQPSQALPEEHLKRFRADKSVWNKTRMNRILVDYLLRKGYYDAAVQLADSAAIKVRIWSLVTVTV